MKIARAHLEYWMRDYYFNTEIDIGSSGVQPFSMLELQPLIDLNQADIDQVIFQDSETLGGISLRQALAHRWTNGEVQQIMATHGSTEANFLIIHALLNPGDEVIVLEPSYQQLFSIAESIGCRLKFWRLKFENDFKAEIRELNNLVTPKTRMIIVNFPHNPTGISLTEPQQDAVVEIASKVGAYILWDAAFAELTYEQPPLPEPTLKYEKAISIGTLSKAYGLPGLRVGWCIATPSILASCAHLRDYISLHLSPLIELIARKAVENGDKLINIRLQQAQQNLSILTSWVDTHHSIVEWVRPQGGVCTFLRFPSIANTELFCRHMAETYKTLLVPGTCFNLEHHVRLGFGGSTGTFKEGLRRLSQALTS